MAAAPVKSQPLHNFTLPSYLNWGGAKNHAAAPSHSRHRRSPLAGDSPPVDHSESEAEFQAHRVGSRAARHRFSVSSCVAPEEPRKEAAAVEKEVVVESAEAAEKKREVDDEAEETVQKPWNLRPRRGAISSKPPGFDQNGELPETRSPARAVAAVQQGQNQAKSVRLRGGKVSGEKEKRRLQIALTREEIEEDIFVMTGSRPTRRPKKRPKNAQRQLDASG